MNNPVVIVIFLCCLLRHQCSFAQNLIYNGSFELYSSCPSGNDLNNGQFEKVKGWWKPTLGTSDYFNSCNPDLVSVPSNFWGYQPAFDGTGYIGLGPAGWYDNGTYNGYEYAQSKLIEPLKECTKYQFTMRVSLANLTEYAFGRLSAFFVTDSLQIPTWDSLSFTPQIVNQTGPITDTVNWTTITGTFVAEGDEKYIILGYGFGNVTNDTVFIQPFPPGIFDHGGYYYIDSVSLIEIGKVPANECPREQSNVFTPNNDGVNDLFLVKGLLPEDSFIIVNRWGNIVFTGNSAKAWDGNSDKGIPCTEGVYFFITHENTGTRQSGYVQLLR